MHYRSIGFIPYYLLANKDYPNRVACGFGHCRGRHVVFSSCVHYSAVGHVVGHVVGRCPEHRGMTAVSREIDAAFAAAEDTPLSCRSLPRFHAPSILSTVGRRAGRQVRCTVGDAPAAVKRARWAPVVACRSRSHRVHLGPLNRH